MSNNNDENNPNNIENNPINNNIDDIMNHDLFHFLLRNSVSNTTFFNRHLINSFISRRESFSPNNMNEILRRSFRQKSTYKNVISDEGLNELKYTLFKDSSKKNTQCPFIL